MKARWFSVSVYIPLGISALLFNIYGRMSFSQLQKTVQALSIDVALGAMCSSALFCRMMGVAPLPWPQLLILGGTVFVIYTADHQLDIYRMQPPPITQRHRFHWQHRRMLRMVAGIVMVLLAVGAFISLPRSVFLYGILLAGAVSAYLLVVSRLPETKAKIWFHKEILIAALYTAGVWGSVAVRAVALEPSHRLSGIIFGLLALQNLALFSYYEWEEDITQQQRSLARAWGKRTVRIGVFMLSGLLLSLLIAAGGLVQSTTEMVSLVTLWAMALILLALTLAPGYFRTNHRYRWLGDGIFLLPVWALFG